jgi:hypothetical protein
MTLSLVIILSFQWKSTTAVVGHSSTFVGAKFQPYILIAEIFEKLWISS